MQHVKQIGRYSSFPVSMVVLVVERSKFWQWFGWHAFAVMNNGQELALSKAEFTALKKEIEVFQGIVQVYAAIEQVQANLRGRQ